ncbi:uncharacterized protein LOC143290898 [Babylonia areolata]|uniref:uncharacterized protein LOC143290898 n=1 Tax=Babylonia areolata TaxID=304850 RepID=UPI003FCFD231
MDTTKVSILACVAFLAVTSQPVHASGMTSEERERVRSLERSVEVLGRQLMMTQLAQHEMWRSDGDSGVKQVRLTRDGTRPYHTNTHSGPSVAAIHDHADLRATCGLGEFEAVLNGVHFRTRHNDFPLRMPASTGEYDGTAAIPFPVVPPAVLQKRSVGEEVEEMREWFRAWRKGDHSKRDYRPYFRPLLCYLEGAWTTDGNLTEPFLSHRHHLDATDLRDLQDKIRFTAYTGDKNLHENLAYLPSMVLTVSEAGATIAQWNYRILCHPIRQEVRVRDLRPVEDLANRLASKHRWRDHVMSRAARFSLSPFPGERLHKWSLLDKIMKEIPGKNNYGGHLIDRTEGGVKLNAHNTRPLNTAHYHRWYRLHKAGAMGEKVAHMGFADRNLFVAETTQPRVAAMEFPPCPPPSSPSPSPHTPRKGRAGCEGRRKRVSFAIPLEIVFLTPLHAWNPYRLHYKGHDRSPLGRSVTAKGRTGTRSVEGAFNGTNSRHFYHTPVTFFQSAQEVHSDPADTVQGVVGVLDPEGRVRSVVASGVRIFLPKIKGLGVLRTRYPIMPVYAEGSAVWKEVEALREVAMGMDRHRAFFRTPPSFLAVRSADGQGDGDSERVRAEEEERREGRGASSSLNQGSLPQKVPHDVRLLSSSSSKLKAGPAGARDVHLVPGNGVLQDHAAPPLPFPERLTVPPPRRLTLVTSPSKHSYVSLHVHTVEVSGDQWLRMVEKGGRVKIRTTLGGGHSHLLELGFDTDTQYFHVHSCDHRATCWDGHPADLETLPDNHLAREPNQLTLFG